MGKFILFLVLALSGSSAFAEWVKVGGSIDGSTTDYVDRATIKHNGDKVKMWVMKDSKTTAKFNGVKFRSILGLSEYNCANEKLRTIQLTAYSGSMGKGQPVWVEDGGSNGWEVIAPGTSGNVMWKIACGEK